MHNESICKFVFLSIIIVKFKQVMLVVARNLISYLIK